MTASMTAARTSAIAAASSGFTVRDAVVIFVVVIVVLAVLVSLVGRRTRRLAFRPRVRSAHSQRIRRAAGLDVEAIERNKEFPEGEAPLHREAPPHRDGQRPHDAPGSHDAPTRPDVPAHRDDDR